VATPARARVSRRLIAAAAAIAGCTAQANWPNDVVLTSAHFTYHARTGEALCPDLMDRLEANLAAVAGVLGIDIEHVHVDYYKYRDVDDIDANGSCPKGWRSCANGSTIHTGALQAFQHELVHAYVARLGTPSNVYQEGLAEMFDCRAMAGPDAPTVSWQDLADVASRPPTPNPQGIGPTAYYSAATFLVRRTIDRFGVEAFMNFYDQGSTNRSTVDQFGAEYQAAFGVPIDTIWDELRSQPTSFGWPFLCPCGAPAATGETVTFDESCATGLPDVTAYTLDATKPLALTVNGAGSNVILRACDGRAPSPAQWMDTADNLLPRERSGATMVTELAAGAFYVGALAGAGELALADTTWLAPTCDAAAELRLGRDVPRDHKLWVSIPSDARRWLRLTTEEPLTQAHAGMFAYCSACPPDLAPESCTSTRSTRDVIPAGSYVVEIPPGLGPRFHAIGVQYDPP
jgi:hypothetical protein